MSLGSFLFQSWWSFINVVMGVKDGSIKAWKKKYGYQKIIQLSFVFIFLLLWMAYSIVFSNFTFSFLHKLSWCRSAWLLALKSLYHLFIYFLFRIFSYFSLLSSFGFIDHSCFFLTQTSYHSTVAFFIWIPFPLCKNCPRLILSQYGFTKKWKSSFSKG